MGEIKGFEDPLLKDMIRFRILSIFFFLELVQWKPQNNPAEHGFQISYAEKIEIFLALRNFLQVKWSTLLMDAIFQIWYDPKRKSFLPLVDGRTVGAFKAQIAHSGAGVYVCRYGSALPSPPISQILQLLMVSTEHADHPRGSLRFETLISFLNLKCCWDVAQS